MEGGLRQVAPLAVIALLVACSAARSPEQRMSAGTLYHLDGIDSADGMSARVDQAGGTIRIAGTILALEDCAGPADVPLCLVSDYFVLHLPRNDMEEWTYRGIGFRRAGHCRLVAPAGVEESIIAVQSDQPHGRFTFYMSPDHRLQGWRIDHPVLAMEVYLPRDAELVCTASHRPGAIESSQ